jgi:6-phosphogluconolactonase
MNVNLFPANSEDELYESALEDVELFVKETLRDQVVCRIALAGGSTPKRLYEMMADLDLPWEKLQFIVIDERYVPSDSKESNLRMMRRALFSKVPMSPEQVFSFDTSLAYKQSAKEMERKLTKLSHEATPLIDLLILGAGADGHVASLYSSDDIDGALAKTTSAKTYKTEKRLSLGMAALYQSKNIMLLLKGEEKASVVESLKTASGSTPIDLLTSKLPTKVHFYL